mmetsp:Transcript_37995/g.62402  ORF Transcript_37995/g.62402 Transcript_37995/m.62402 type:complete len:244 (+) Transcript_37995:41-772(+)
MGNVSCCIDFQICVVVTIIVSAIVITLLWRRMILKPFKLITVFLHELGHATAALITCGKVRSIRVDENEGGLTETQGGSMICILPAGYLGSSFWGAFFILMSAACDATCRWTVRIAAGWMIAVMLFVLIFKSANNTIRWLLLLFIVIFLAVFILDELVVEFNWELAIFMLFFGTMNSLFAILDIYDDLISRTVYSSDASRFAELTKTNSKCWGIIWGIMAVIWFGLTLYLSVVISGITTTCNY